MAAGLYTAIEVFGAKKEWGDSVKGLHMTIAINSLKTLNSNISTHTKNWRPQVLLLNKLKGDGSSVIKYPKLLGRSWLEIITISLSRSRWTFYSTNSLPFPGKYY